MDLMDNIFLLTTTSQCYHSIGEYTRQIEFLPLVRVIDDCLIELAKSLLFVGLRINQKPAWFSIDNQPGINSQTGIPNGFRFTNDYPLSIKIVNRWSYNHCKWSMDTCANDIFVRTQQATIMSWMLLTPLSLQFNLLRNI